MFPLPEPGRTSARPLGEGSVGAEGQHSVEAVEGAVENPTRVGRESCVHRDVLPDVKAGEVARVVLVT